MKKEMYETLSRNEKLMYDELSSFAVRVTERLDETIELLKTIIAMGEEI